MGSGPTRAIGLDPEQQCDQILIHQWIARSRIFTSGHRARIRVTSFSSTGIAPAVASWWPGRSRAANMYQRITARNIQRQKTVCVVIGLEMTAPLLAMHGAVRGIHFEDDFHWRRMERVEEQVDQQLSQCLQIRHDFAIYRRLNKHALWRMSTG